MAKTTGPVRTSPGFFMDPDAGAMCDEHPDRPSYRLLQGETTPTATHWNDWCEECFGKFDSLYNSLPTQRRKVKVHCDFCGLLSDTVERYRDPAENNCGPFYQACKVCREA